MSPPTSLSKMPLSWTMTPSPLPDFDGRAVGRGAALADQDAGAVGDVDRPGIVGGAAGLDDDADRILAGEDDGGVVVEIAAVSGMIAGDAVAVRGDLGVVGQARAEAGAGDIPGEVQLPAVDDAGNGVVRIEADLCRRRRW